MRKLVMVCVTALVLALTCTGRSSRADNESDRRSLISDIDGLLREVSDYLRSAGTSTSANEVDSARDRANRIRDKLSALDRVKDDDEKANRYSSNFPRYLEDFDRATQALRQAKADQTSINGVPRRCQDLDRQITDLAQQLEREKDGSRIEELRRTALDAGAKAEEWWKDADQRRQAFSRALDDAKRFSVSDDEWSRVTSSLADAATRSLDAWMHDFAAMETACKDLRQRDRHPAVEQALRSLEGTAKGKDQLYQQLDEKLKRAENDFRDLFGASDSSKAADARQAIDEVDRLVRDLDSAKGSDKKANQITSTWPDFVRAYAPAGQALIGLKDAERELDDVPYKCANAARDLQDKMTSYLSQNDPDGLHEIPPQAEALGTKYTSALAAVDAARPTRESLVSQVGSFDPRDDRWQPLRKQMKDAADQLYAYWDQHRQTAHQSCDELAKGVRNPAVEQFLTALGGKAQSDLKDFQDKAAAWERDARDIYMLDCTDMQHLWDASCEVDFEPNEPPEVSVLQQETARIIDANLAKIDGVLARLGPMRTTAGDLVRKAKYRDAVEKIRTSVFDKQEGRLQNLRRQNGEWKGSNNPALAFAANYGKQAHDRMGSSFSCNVYDKPYPGLGQGRPDCVKVAGPGACYVYEFKPKDYSGPLRLAEYVTAVEAYHTEKMRRDEPAESALGGAAFQALVESNCRRHATDDKKSDSIEFQSDVKPYDRCVHQYVCTEAN